MINVGDWATTGAGLLGAALLGINVGRLLRVYVKQRARVQVERERSARSLAHTESLVRLARARRRPIRVRERDGDGRRVIESGPAERRKEAA
jgi:hypothetical protein